MPARLAASMTSVPGGACTGFPSIVRFTKSAMERLSRHHELAGLLVRAGLAVQMVLELVVKLLHNRHRGHGRGVAQRAEGPAEHVLGQVADQRDIAPLAHAVVEALEQFADPGSALAAGNAPAAAFVG